MNNKDREPTFLGLGYAVQGVIGWVLMIAIGSYSVWAIFLQSWP